MDEVSKVSGCSHGLLYHYFKGKEDLYRSVICNIVSPYIQDVIQGISFEQKAKFVVHDLLDAVLKRIKMVDDKNAWKIYLFLNVHLQKNLFNKKQNERTPMFEKILELVERGQKEGDFNDHPSAELAISILSLIKGLSYTRIHIGYKRFLCPNSDIVMRMLYK